MAGIRSDARHIPLKDQSVQCVVTSPPYWGLRDYDTPGQLGLESTPEEYTTDMVEVFREVWRVLKDDGTLWLNLGDSYSGSWARSSNPGGKANSPMQRSNSGSYVGECGAAIVPPGLKPKDLVGIPWRVAFALQADGWYLRSDIIWAKPNPMPESVTDRPTKAHEYLFLMSKSKRYYYDADAIKEPVAFASVGRLSQEIELQSGSGRAHGGTKINGNMKAVGNKISRNKRTVWTIATKPFSGAHFATFPRKLVEPCILAGSKPGDVVLDPFSGSGTTVRVAEQHNRKGVGCDLTYHDIAEKRTRNIQRNLL